MRAMILAAGRGERMRPLTDTTPKPLLQVGGKALIEYHLEKLARLGVEQVIINHAWLGEQLEQQLGDGERYGLDIIYSPEPVGGLETAGGIIRALPWLGEAPFWIVNGDVFTDFDFAEMPTSLPVGQLAHLLFTANPEHNLEGDFAITEGIVRPRQRGLPTYTYAGIGLYSPALFAGFTAGSEQFLRLRPVLDQAVLQQQVSATIMSAAWTDVGTPQRLAELQENR